MESIDKRIKKKVQEIESKQARLDRESVQTDRKIKTFSGLAWFFVVIGGVVGIFGLFLFSIRFPSTPNELGDFYSGTVGSLWSLAGLFFIYVAFLGQKKQLSLQQIELMNSQLEVLYTQSELKGQREAMNAQNELLTQQKFESTFFKLMEHHNNMIETLKFETVDNPKKVVHGKEIIDLFISYLRQKRFFNGKHRNITEDDATMLYIQTYNNQDKVLGIYLRSLYQIIKFVDQSVIPDKKRYTNFVRAQLSEAEIELLIYNCLSIYGKEKFKPLVVKYMLFKHFENGELTRECIERGSYPKEVFGL